MAASDFIQLNPGSGGDKASADTILTVKHPRVKMQFGETGSATDVSATDPMPVSQAINGAQNHLVMRFLDTVGDGTGTTNANGDYSVTQGIFRIAPGAGEIFRISRMIIMVEDTSGMTPVEYGNIGSALTNGIQLRCHDGTTTICDFTNGDPITRNGDWAGRCYDANLLTWGASNEILAIRWTFTESGQFIRLDGDANEELQIVLDDDMTDLINHTFYINGYKESDPT